MPESVYKIITIIGSSQESWEKAAAAAVKEVSKSVQDLRIAEVEEMDMHLSGAEILTYRVKLRISFRYHGKEEE